MAARKIPFKLSKPVVILTSSLALGIGAYAAYRYWKKKESECVDEGFEDTLKAEDNPEKRVLVLGLESSGKTTLITQLATNNLNIQDVRPTEGFHVVNLNYEDKALNIWDVGGSENIRRFWSNFFQDTALLVFVVDAADTHGLLVAVKEIKALAGDERLKNVPIIVVANKQDLHGALTPIQVADVLDMKSISPTKHKVKVLGTQVIPGIVHPSVLALKKAILEMV